MKTWIAGLSALLFSLNVPAFEIDQIKSGMDRATVREKLAGWNFDKIQDFSDDVMIAYDFPEKKTHRQFTFGFCNNRLVSFEQEVQPSLKHFIVISGNFNRDFGQPIRTDAITSVVAVGERSFLGMYWRKGNEFVGVKYIQLPSGEQLLTVYEAPNSCWKVPKS